MAVSLLYMGCSTISTSSNKEMAELLSSINLSESVVQNSFYPEAGVKFCDSVLEVSKSSYQRDYATLYKAGALLQLGREQEAIRLLQPLEDHMDINSPVAASTHTSVMKTLAIAWLRIGERSNCIYSHSAESCVFPISGNGVHVKKTGSEKAIAIYQSLLQANPSDLESRWLLNIAYMTIGEYPGGVPPDYLLKGLDTDSGLKIKPFTEMAVSTGVDINNMAGGSIIDDFNNDGNLDIVTSGWGLTEGMHYCRNNGNGTFTNLSALSGLSELTGGLNIMQTDYNNDGLKDIFVLRGAWKGNYGREPVSLLKNNGDGSFTDVTKQSGLLAFHPTQTATWADFNNDGWLDVFIGTESKDPNLFPCQLYINNKNGTFTEMAVRADCAIYDFVKGVNSGDYNNDGWPDIFVSALTGEKRLLRNDGLRNGVVHFTDVADQAGIKANHEPGFGTWFWDFDNDGWSDIVVNNYNFKGSLSVYAAAEALHQPIDEKAGRTILFRNNHDGTFTDVSEAMGLNKVVFSMGCNFGDIDNDGYPDMYFGTGNPSYQSLVPNKLFKNIGGKRFADVTSSGRVGNLQKGHGVAFADIDNDGDEDIYIDMGGAYIGDAYQNLLYINPGQSTNHWLSVELEGVKSNRPAIGARIKISFKEDGVERHVYADVNSGGSFGANPLRQHLGMGTALTVDSLEIRWPGSGTKQVFTHLVADQFLRIREGDSQVKRLSLLPFSFAGKGLPGCAPER